VTITADTTEETAIDSMTRPESGSEIRVGVDTHKDFHVAVALDRLGARLGELQVTTNSTGYARLEKWTVSLGQVQAFGVEGTGSYGAGLARFLRSHGHRVVEVNRPDRATRYRLGKSDPIDAEMAARSLLSGTATGAPKTGDGAVEMIRMLKLAKDSAVKGRTQAVNQINAVLVTAPAELRESLAGLSVRKLLDRCAALRPGELTNPTAAAKYTLRLLARRNLSLLGEVEDLRRQIGALVVVTAPKLVEVFGVGPDSAAALLIAAGDNPLRLHSEAGFAALCGSNPIPASSGKTQRHRLNRGGDRQANAALYRVVLVRLRWHEPTQKYMARRLGEGKTKAEVIRCLKRYVAREIYTVVRATPRQQPASQLHQAA
jgi:transposase